VLTYVPHEIQQQIFAILWANFLRSPITNSACQFQINHRNNVNTNRNLLVRDKAFFLAKKKYLPRAEENHIDAPTDAAVQLA
jgi:hypothetical protein